MKFKILKILYYLRILRKRCYFCTGKIRELHIDSNGNHCCHKFCAADPSIFKDVNLESSRYE